MIISLTAVNWKSLSEATLNVDPLTVIIGNNASGKSNVLDAFSFLNRISQGTLLTQALQGDMNLPQLRGGLEWAARYEMENFTLSVVVYSDETTEYEYKIECKVHNKRCDLVSEQLIRKKYRLKKGIPNKENSYQINLLRTDSVEDGSSVITARLYNEKQGTPRQFNRSGAILSQLVGQKLRSEIEDGVNLVSRSLRNIFLLDPIPSNMRAFSQLSDKMNSDASNIAGVLAALPLGVKESIENTIKNYAGKLPEQDIEKVYAEPVGKFQSDAMLYCEESYGPKTTIVDARGMSDGTLRFIAILTALQTRPENSLLIIEEVDNGFHPSRSSLLLDVLKNIGKKNNVDVIVTTHNPALLDAMGPEMVPFITVAHRNTLTGTTELTLLEDIHELPRLLAVGKVGRISSDGLIEKALTSQDEER